jgi:uncharacterized membrane protein YciS (DUF1049 family)
VITFGFGVVVGAWIICGVVWWSLRRSRERPLNVVERVKQANLDLSDE